MLTKSKKILELETQVSDCRRTIASKDKRISELELQVEKLKQREARPTTDADVLQAMRDTIRDGLNKLEQPAPLFGRNLSSWDIFTLAMSYIALCNALGVCATEFIADTRTA